jgi:AraC family transcriptional regulator
MPRWLRQCLDIIEEEYAEPLTVAAIARRVGVHPVHASREFRRRYGITIGEYANKVRVRAACRRISRERESLALVAHESGFADHAHFCRVFKSTLGCTPSEFALLRYSM